MKALLEAADPRALNDNKMMFPEFDPHAPFKRVMAANDANFDASNLSEPLTEFIAGHGDPIGLDQLLENACPSVPTARAFDYFKHDSKEHFQIALNNEDIRQIYGDFAEIRKTGEKIESSLHNKGLTIILDNDAGGDNPATQQRAVEHLRHRLLRSELYRLELLLEANATASTPNWGPTNPTADPDYDIISDVAQGGTDRGIDSNVVFIGGEAWKTRFRSLGPTATRSSSPERGADELQLSSIYNVDRVIKSKVRYQSSATAKAEIVGNKVYTYYNSPVPTETDPSNFKRFYLPFSEGEMFRVYIHSLLKRTFVTLEHYSLVAMPSNLGIRKIAPTFS